MGVIILYDHVHPVGAFAKTSKIDVSYIVLFNFKPFLEVEFIGIYLKELQVAPCHSPQFYSF